MNKGILYGIFAYFLWGVFPLYWKLLKDVPAQEILCHRMVWSLVFMVLLLCLRRQWQWISKVKQQPKILLTFLLTASILSLNWFTFIWAVNHGFIVEASLGYFINPLLNVVLGVVFLHERLRFFQWGAILLAAIAVTYLTVNHGTFPWIAIVLACSFGTYGLLRKTAALGSLEGLTLETGFLFLPAISFIFHYHYSNKAAFIHNGSSITTLLIFSGVVTALPLMLFASSARRISLTALGLLQYLAPTLQFLIGVFVYNEPFNQNRFIGFFIIWTALAIYTTEGLLFRRKKTGY